jgi:uncharacterized phage protein (TIGR01671 family)
MDIKEREIKFRAWDKIDNLMFPVAGLSWHGGSPSFAEVQGMELETNRDTLLLTSYTENYVLMQYTGLKDKNGKEAYHSDIAETVNDKQPTRWVVCWSDTEAGFVLSNPKYDWLPVRKIKEMNIIGNIYEHPKLIKEK